MLFLSLKTISDAHFAQLNRYLHRLDGVELRFEHIDLATFEKIKKWMKTKKCKVIFAWKMAVDLVWMERLLALQPDYFDIDHQVDDEGVQCLQDKYPKSAWIISHHDFEKMPHNLLAILSQMRQKKGQFYKLALFSQSSLDALWMLSVLKNERDVIAIAMGEHGRLSRALAPIRGAPINYTCLPNERSAPGQIDVDELFEVYHYDRLGVHTQLYGLIGDPVEFSYSHITHNDLFYKLNLPALYLKISVSSENFSKAIAYLNALGFKGLSITTPLKEIAYAHTECVEEEAVQAINTYVLNKAINTDGKGAVDLIERRKPIYGMRILVLGAGATAQAIICEIKKRGGEPIVWNRTMSRAKELAKRYDCPFYQGQVYDCIVQATSCGFGGDSQSEEILSLIRPNCLALEVIANPVKTPFLNEVERLGGECIPGIQMFARQAAYQFHAWLQLDIEKAYMLLYEKLTEILYEKTRHSTQLTRVY
ncbi:MAG: type I 3-dehydroquinate dehydratase [Simkaniaceae bacterium]|nr:type I 3-dehydroquinate dehydratase [Simkaniaceae bacterium]MCF7852789.1 type I 3-dehydroquinate dehydratase [Simkaniaceae bacterium]